MNTQSSLHQAAMILKSLPKRQAAAILSRLRAADMKQVLEAVNLLDQVTGEQLNESLERLNQEARRWTSTPAENREAVEHLRQITQSNAVARPPEHKTPSHYSRHPFGFLIETLPMIRDQVLLDEHPKNIAIVLSSLPPDVASSCLKSLEPIVRVSVLKRLCELDELDKEEVNQLSYALKLRHQKLYNRNPLGSPGLKTAAAMLSCTDPDTQATLVAMLEQSDPELADELQKSLVTLENLLNFEDGLLKELLNQVDTSFWAPALKKASNAVQQKVLRNMAERPAQLLCQQMADLGDVDPRVERFARQQIINQAVLLSRSTTSTTS